MGARPLQLYLLRGSECCVLLDTGCAPDPDEIIFPYLRSLGLGPRDLDMVINTHCDMDHCGGNYAVKQANPQTQITCGERDKPLIEDPQAMWSRRYNAYQADHGICYDSQTRSEIFNTMGSAQPVDHTWRGGETIDLGHGWKVEVHHTPGHSPGHLAIFDPRSRTMLSGDAVHGAVYPDTDGNPALCPTYLAVGDYVDTIRYLQSIPIERLLTCHWPVKRGAAVGEFLVESLAFVKDAEHAILGCIEAASDGLTLQQVIQAVGPVLGAWPRHVDSELVYAIAGHMEDLQSRGLVAAIPGTHPVVFRFASCFVGNCGERQ
jgi:glyoxylase-like metal-dependent hydrolase (beta-lactamase superfamily II)